eukprot:TRINITY_DN6606_c0_g1_i1.p1 TRINITY_DN6606_c0_g1~~TRINITY_DN6606_c0_g1_i1.p1  ORF type:complete len:308 (-),score=52.15 TRINITY_DN6606_c0_g1_i1:36-959(-)
MIKSTSNSKKPNNSAFKQQKLKAWQPILTPIPVITTFFIIGVIFIPLGVFFLITSNQVHEYQERYDNVCGNSSRCNITFQDVDMKPPIFVYYKLSNYYQNHRRYVKSRNDDQLRGKIVKSSSSLADCSPRRSNGSASNSSNIYLPCGLIAWSLFNDTYVLRDSSGAIVPLDKKGIAWSSDIGEKFKNPPESDQIRVIPDFEDEDFIVWMRVAGLPTFKKLWRKIHIPLNGTISVEISNNYPVESFDGKKYLVISEVSWLGGKNPFLGYAYIIVGAVCIFLAFVFLLKHKISGRALGDSRYLAWNQST